MEQPKPLCARAWSGPRLTQILRLTHRLVLSSSLAVAALPAIGRAATPLGAYRCDIPWLTPVARASGPTSPYRAGIYLLYLQNDSGKEVRLNFDLPWGWVDPTPKYPISVQSSQMLIDERKYDEILETTNLIACRIKSHEWTGKKISNVALPTSCENETSVRMRVVATDKTFYLRWCNDKVVMRPGSHEYTPKNHAGVRFFAIYVDKSGTPTFKKVQ